MKIKMFKSFLESVKSHNPSLINAIMEGFDTLVEADQPVATRGDALKVENQLKTPTTQTPTVVDYYKGLDKKTTELGKLNNLPNPNLIQIGQKLKLADGSDYTVVKGDTVSGIAHGKGKATTKPTEAKPATTNAKEVVKDTAQYKADAIKNQAKNAEEMKALNPVAPAPQPVANPAPVAKPVAPSKEQIKNNFIKDSVARGNTPEVALAEYNKLTAKPAPVQQAPVAKPAPQPPKVIAPQPVAKAPAPVAKAPTPVAPVTKPAPVQQAPTAKPAPNVVTTRAGSTDTSTDAKGNVQVETPQMTKDRQAREASAQAKTQAVMDNKLKTAGVSGFNDNLKNKLNGIK